MRSHKAEQESPIAETSSVPMANHLKGPKAHHAELLSPSLSPTGEEFESSVQVRSGSKSQPRIPEFYRIQWGTTAWLVALHLGALAAPWTFSWSGLFLCLFIHWINGSLGICLGYHRLLTHTGLEVPGWVKYTLTFFGVLSGEGGPISWTANHRKHHAYSDQPGDPHSPHEGPWWAHMFWLAFSTDNGDFDGFAKHWVPDLVKDKGLMFFEKFFLPIHIAFGAMLAGIAYMIDGPSLAISWLVWAVCVRMVAVLHVTWFVNSASHIWGYKNYETRDDSRNLWWVAIVAYGEGWHNNHHALPRLAQHGHKWWEFDITFQAIRFLRAVGLAKNVMDLKAHEEKQRKRAERAVA
jgi:stearoyl-CoA desaturase (delta-9 desaturase)